MDDWGEKEAERIANCAVGNGFHIPSIMLIFMLLLQSAAGHVSPQRGMTTTESETKLAMRVRDSVFDDYALRSAEGLITPD